MTMIASAKIIDNQRTAKVSKDYRTVLINQNLPFYVSFRQILIAGYGPSSPAPIGIAVVGFSNHIL